MALKNKELSGLRGADPWKRGHGVFAETRCFGNMPILSTRVSEVV
jgi:hypothetical protein